MTHKCGVLALMLFELAIASGVIWFGTTGQGFRVAARNAGRVLGRATGSLRRARAEVDRVQARAEALGGAELSKNRAEIAARLQQLNAIRAETTQLLSMHGGGGGVREASSFTDEELAGALGVLPTTTASKAVASATLESVSISSMTSKSRPMEPSVTRPFSSSINVPTATLSPTPTPHASQTLPLNASLLIAQLMTKQA